MLLRKLIGERRAASRLTWPLYLPHCWLAPKCRRSIQYAAARSPAHFFNYGQKLIERLIAEPTHCRLLFTDGLPLSTFRFTKSHSDQEESSSRRSPPHSSRKTHAQLSCFSKQAAKRQHPAKPRLPLPNTVNKYDDGNRDSADPLFESVYLDTFLHSVKQFEPDFTAEDLQELWSGITETASFSFHIGLRAVRNELLLGWAARRVHHGSGHAVDDTLSGPTKRAYESSDEASDELQRTPKASRKTPLSNRKKRSAVSPPNSILDAKAVKGIEADTGSFVGGSYRKPRDRASDSPEVMRKTSAPPLSSEGSEGESMTLGRINARETIRVFAEEEQRARAQGWRPPVMLPPDRYLEFMVDCIHEHERRITKAAVKKHWGDVDPVLLERFYNSVNDIKMDIRIAWYKVHDPTHVLVPGRLRLAAASVDDLGSSKRTTLQGKEQLPVTRTFSTATAKPIVVRRAKGSQAPRRTSRSSKKPGNYWE